MRVLSCSLAALLLAAPAWAQTSSAPPGSAGKSGSVFLNIFTGPTVESRKRRTRAIMMGAMSLPHPPKPAAPAGSTPEANR